MSTQTETLGRSEYINEVENQATALATHAADAADDGEYDSYHDAVLDLAMDILDGHEWFARSYYGPALHGAIIEYALDECNDDVHRYHDIEAMLDVNEVAEAVKRLAYMVFETHVIETAKARGRGAV